MLRALQDYQVILGEPHEIITSLLDDFNKIILGAIIILNNYV